MEHPSDIRNKHKRQEIVLKKKMGDRREAKMEKLKVKKVRAEHGEEAAPKGKTETIESMRVKDETIITEVDDEIKGEQSIDEFSKYFNRETTPRILMTTNRRPKGKLFDFLKEIKGAFPATEYYERKNFEIKKVIEWAKERGFTDLMLWYEKHGKPHSLILSHLPEGPTATFRVSGLKLRHEIRDHGAAPGDVHPELIMNNFDTMLGHRMGRMLASLFPQSPHLKARRVVTMHNQRDFVFFRHHRYEFNEDGSRANLQEVGPRFTLKLHSLQLGTMDKKHGEFEFIYKPRDGVNRKKFFL
jgi:ribosome production factor 1